MRILHSSDLHGSYKTLLAIDEPFDVWLDTGDFFPNRGRVPGTGYAIVPEMERRHQVKWDGYKRVGAKLAAWLDGRPALTMPGNHDFIPLVRLLTSAGADARQITPEGVEALGLTWAGFREIPLLEREWVGETDAFDALLAQLTAAAPDIVVTHAPPLGVLDGGPAGVPGLREAIATWRPRAHFFGHDHADGGKAKLLDGTQFVNGATCAFVIEV
jgi:Icc-related predicted phosphoesterase